MRSLALFIMVALLIPGRTFAADCQSRFSSITIHEEDDFHVMVNGVQVTGEAVYPLRKVLSTLGLTRAEVQALQGKRVLSLGEGFSGLVPHLRNEGVDALGLDLWYGEKELPSGFTGWLMNRFRNENQGHLITGSAFAIPLETGSVDAVVSHKLVNNLKKAGEHKALLAETVRVLKPGGQARIAGFGALTLARAIKFLKAEYGSSLKLNYRKKKSKWKSFGFDQEEELYLLMIEKK